VALFYCLQDHVLGGPPLVRGVEGEPPAEVVVEQVHQAVSVGRGYGDFVGVCEPFCRIGAKVLGHPVAPIDVTERVRRTDTNTRSPAVQDLEVLVHEPITSTA